MYEDNRYDFVAIYKCNDCKIHYGRLIRIHTNFNQLHEQIENQQTSQPQECIYCRKNNILYIKTTQKDNALNYIDKQNGQFPVSRKT